MERYFTREGRFLPQDGRYHVCEETRFTCEEGYSFEVHGVNLPELYTNRSQCCGCGACVVACPVGAITMHPDPEGFLYPVVNASSCVGCRKCMSACSFKGR